MKFQIYRYEIRTEKVQYQLLNLMILYHIHSFLTQKYESAHKILKVSRKIYTYTHVYKYA